MKNIEEITNEQRIALIKLAVLGSFEILTENTEFSDEQFKFLEDIAENADNCLEGVELNGETADKVIHIISDLLAFIDKLPKE